jgi:hypothetical protein
MRGEDRTSGALFSYVEVEARIPARHPLRAMRRLTNAALAELDARFSALYQGIGRPSIPPERLLRASLPLGGCNRSCSTSGVEVAPDRPSASFTGASFALLFLPKPSSARHRNTTLVTMPCRRATDDTVSPALRFPARSSAFLPP